MILFFLVAYKEFVHINNAEGFYVFKSFGATKNSKFRINISNSNSEILFVGLCNANDLTTLWNPLQDYRIACTAKKKQFAFLNGTIDMNLGNTKALNITRKEVISPIIIPCKRKNITADVSIAIDSPILIDYRLVPIKGIAATMIAILCLIFVVFIVLVFTNNVLFIITHILIIVCFIFAMSVNILLLAFIVNGTINEKRKVLIIYDAIYQAFLFAVLNFISYGLGYIAQYRIEFPVVSFVLGVFAVHSNYLTFFTNIGNFITIFSILQALAFIAETVIVYANVQRTEMKLIAYQNVVMAEGIDPITAPLRSKLLAYYRFNYCFLAYVALRILILFIDVLMRLDISITYALNQIVDNVLIAFLLIDFSPFKIKRIDWNQMYEDTEECESAEKRIFVPAQNIPLKKWDGQKLPFPPILTPPSFERVTEGNDELLINNLP